MFQLPLPVRDAATDAGGDALGNLPEWNLNDLYTGEDAPELTRDLDWLEGECASFAADYEGKLADLDAAGRASRKLAAMPEVQRETILAERAEKRDEERRLRKLKKMAEGKERASRAS